MNPKIKARAFSQIRLHVIVLLVILVSFSPLLGSASRVVTSLVVLLLTYSKSWYDKKRGLWFLSLLLAPVVYSFAFDINYIFEGYDFNGSGVYILFCLIVGFLVSRAISCEEYLLSAERIIFLTAVFSLIGVFVYTFLPSIVNLLPTYTYYEFSSKTALIFNVLSSDIGIVKRNMGIASEPGLFQLMLNIGLWFHLRREGGYSVLRASVYILALIFTQSTAGFVILALIIFLRRPDRLTLIVVVLALASFSILSDVVQFHAESKWVGTASFEERYLPTLNVYSGVSDNFLGLGAVQYSERLKVENIGAWDTFGMVLIRYGVPMLLVVLIGVLLVAKETWTFSFILLGTFFTQAVWFFPFVVPFYFWAARGDLGRARSL